MEDLGWKFFAGLAGALLAGGIVLLIILVLFTHLVYALGVLGAFIVLAGAALLFGWLFDRRQARRRADYS
jgi:Flp pilus assembly protein TadB